MSTSPCNVPEPKPGQRLDNAAFECVIKLTPLVSIDLLIRDKERRVWVGTRRNRPAQDMWFVPGGRITKNEKVEEAFARLTRKELGTELSLSDATLLGVYNHIYPDNFFDKPDFGTHYVVLGYEILWHYGHDPVSEGEHSEAFWKGEMELLKSPLVHPNTRAYFV